MHPRLRHPSIALALMCATSALAFTAPAVAQDGTDTGAVPQTNDATIRPGDIVVTGGGDGSSVLSDIPPDEVLDEAAIASYGASNLTDLVAALAVQTGSGRGRANGPPVILLNGRRISGFAEVRNLPPEAVLRMEIFPEEVALEYGYSADQRVINFVLRPQFSAITTELEIGGPTAGGRVTQEAELSLLQLSGRSRINITAGYERSTALTEAERAIIQSPRTVPLSRDGAISAPAGGAIDPALSLHAGRPVTLTGVPAGGGTLADFAALADRVTADDAGLGRTLLPATDQYSIDATVARPFSNVVGGSLNVRLTRTDTASLIGLSPATIVVGAANPASPFSNDIALTRLSEAEPLRGASRSEALNVGATIDGRLAGWRWSVTGNYDRGVSRTTNDRGLNIAALQAAVDAGLNPFARDAGTGIDALNPDRTRTITNTADVTLVVSGSLFALPAGAVRTTLQGGWRDIGLTARSERSDIVTLTDLGRTALSASMTIDVPIASRRDDVLPVLGELSLNGRVGLRDVSDFSTLISRTFGVTWSPVERVDIIATWTTDEAAPSVSQLGAPTLRTPLRPLYDFTTGQTVLATLISGGNPALLAETRRDFKLTGNWRPLEDIDLTLTATYGRAISDDVTADFPLLTPEIEAAFPGRVVRDGAGSILSLDTRPINFAQTRSEQIRYGISFARTFGAPASGGAMARGGPAGPQAGGAAGAGAGAGAPAASPAPPASTDAAAQANLPPPGVAPPAGGPGRPGGGGFGGRPGGGGGGGPGFGRMFGGPGSGGRWSIAAYHTIRLTDEVLIRPGVPTLDLLGGSATGSSGGTARHDVQVEGGWFNRGIGIRANGTWQSGSLVNGTPAAGGGTTGDLRFSSLFTLNAFMFVDLGQQANLVRAVPLLRNARIRFAVSNIFDDVRDVRDATGNVPLRYQPAYIDPVGRSFEIDFRKLF